MRAPSERLAIGQSSFTALAAVRLRTGSMLRKAVQKAKQVAVARAPTDLHIAREARRKASAEQHAARLAQDECADLEQAAAALQEKLAALESLRLERLKRKASLIALQAAARHDRSLRWQLFVQRWLVLSPLKLAAGALAIGLVLGLVTARPALLTSISVINVASAQEPLQEDDQKPPFAYEDAIGVTPRLKLDRNLMPH